MLSKEDTKKIWGQLEEMVHNLLDNHAHGRQHLHILVLRTDTITLFETSCVNHVPWERAHNVETLVKGHVALSQGHVGYGEYNHYSSWGCAETDAVIVVGSGNLPLKIMKPLLESFAGMLDGMSKVSFSQESAQTLREEAYA